MGGVVKQVPLQLDSLDRILWLGDHPNFSDVISEVALLRLDQ